MISKYIEWNGWRGTPKIGKGRVLAHNHIMHTSNMPTGLNGFRAWTWRADEVPEHFKPCPCGWSGLPHYAMEDHIEATKGRCETQKHFEKRMGATMETIMAEMMDD